LGQVRLGWFMISYVCLGCVTCPGGCLWGGKIGGNPVSGQVVAMGMCAGAVPIGGVWCVAPWGDQWVVHLSQGANSYVG
jgi:hypothetical protein